MPVISNYNNTYPISYYTVEYRPTSSPSSPFTRFNTSDNATLSVTISGLSVGVLYSFKVTPFNYGSGSPNSVEGTFRISKYSSVVICNCFIIFFSLSYDSFLPLSFQLNPVVSICAYYYLLLLLYTCTLCIIIVTFIHSFIHSFIHLL